MKEKYKIDEAYYFIGYFDEQLENIYNNLQKSGFILVFREHTKNMKGNKKGNVDVDIVFRMMKEFIESDNITKFVLVSGDGDYKKMIDYFLKKNRLLKILFPNKKFASSLYKKLGSEYYDYLNNIKDLIEYK